MLPDENIYSETYHEAVNIAEMLRSCGVEPDLKTDDSGVEESFKALSGRQFELLHIATHGFYMPGHTEYQTSEELLSPMMRSGLMLSRKKTLSADDREDGLLLAREIADMDLSAVDLVVLSALPDCSGRPLGQRDFRSATRVQAGRRRNYRHDSMADRQSDGSIYDDGVLQQPDRRHGTARSVPRCTGQNQKCISRQGLGGIHHVGLILFV